MELETYEKAYQYILEMTMKIQKGLETLLETTKCPIERNKWSKELEGFRATIQEPINRKHVHIRRENELKRSQLEGIQSLWQQEGLAAEERVVRHIEGYEADLPAWQEWIVKEEKNFRKWKPKLKRYLEDIEGRLALIELKRQLMCELKTRTEHLYHTTD